MQEKESFLWRIERNLYLSTIKQRQIDMKTFKDLTFEPHPFGKGEHATLLFDNGRAVSVLTGSEFNTSDGKPFEVGSIKLDGKLGAVEGHCTEDDVTLIMEAIQKL